MAQIVEAGGVMSARRHLPHPPAAWVALPTPRYSRWFVPRQAGAVSERSFLIHHPVTIRSRIAWEAARFVAARGGLRLLPPSAMVPRDVWEAVTGLVPEKGSVAVARANHPGRFFSMVLGAKGELVAFVKVARDTGGAAALERERRALETFGPFLSPPLFAPRILEADDGLLVMEAIEWQRRPRPWVLPPEVARALGRFFRSSASEEDGSLGATHGDCTPWNLLQTANGWALVDWESAERHVPPFFDPFHFLVQSSIELKRPTKRAIIDGLNLKGWVGASIAAFADGAEVDPGEATGRFTEYLAYSAGRVEIDAPSRALKARRTLLHLLREAGRA